MTPKPKVSIGMPVYNGEKLIRETLDSLRDQTFTDYELIICDNASEDSTEEICREYAVRDERIRYYRNDTNIGAAPNYNKTFELARGEYFKWAAHDDICAPTFLEQCVEALDRYPEVVLAFTRAKAIDIQGEIVIEYPARKHFNATEPRTRFYEFVFSRRPVVVVFGVIRREVLGRTRLIGGYAGSDRPLLSELSLLGKFYEVPEFLFFYRFHEEQSWGGHKEKKSMSAQNAWYDTRRSGKNSYPWWRLVREHARSIERSPIGLQDRLTCYLYLGYWMGKQWRRLGNELLPQYVQSHNPLFS
ncbi:MAG: glycosyltransferase family 2 protein [Chloroflexota bacterium]|jgi:glycosyltransferase involved in cell wall biosynthesis